MKKLKIYVAGAYSADTEEQKLNNTIKAIDAGLEILKLGHYPFIPHLSHWVDLRAVEKNIELTYQEYMDWDDVFLKDCDALFYLSSSNGADIELNRAKELGKIIFYSIEEVPKLT